MPFTFPRARPFALGLSLALSAGVFAAPAAAQTTHVVQLFTVSFSPSSLTIQEGDTVRWEWATNFHDVVSGTSGTADGNFFSGPPQPPPATFEITFDAAFLAANPMPGDVYPYYCSIHLPVMTGTITVESATIPPSVTPYGSGINPPGSLVILDGEPKVGAAFRFGVSNPADVNAPEAFAFLNVALLPDPNFPNGTPLPGFGLGTPGGVGELLLNVLPPDPLFLLGPVLWTGGNSPPAQFLFGIPNSPGLAGLAVHFQGALLTPAQGFTIGLTNGLRIVIGS